MTIEGSLRTMTAADLLEWIRSRKVAGRLSVRRDSILRSLETDGTSITWVSSNRPEDVLSMVLRARGLIDADGLERAATTEVASGVMLGQALVASGVLTETTVMAVLDSQIREAAMDIMSWNRGGFRFVPGRSDRRNRLTVSVAIFELLSTGRGLGADWAALRSAAPNLASRFWKMAEHQPDEHPDTDEARDRHRLLISEIEGGASLGHLIASAKSERFVTLADLAVLHGRRVIGVVPQVKTEGSKDTEAIRHASAARAALAEGNRMEALRLAKLAAQADRGSDELSKLLSTVERDLVSHLARSLLGSHRIPRRIASEEDIAQAELSDHERYALDRVDGVWDLFSLVTSSALGEVASLVTYKQLDERGLIAL